MTRAARTLLPARLTLGWMVPALVFGGLSILAMALGRAPGVTDVFFREQDLWVAVLIAAFVMALRFVPASALPAPRLPGRSALLVAGLAAFVAVVGFVGWYLVMRRYPLSTDEFMALFDAAIFREGRLYATIPEAWRAWRGPIQPQFTLFAPDGASWTSTYLPTNAMALALFSRLGSTALGGAVWSAVGVVATWAAARRLWPERREPAVVAVVLLASSSQLLLTAMTPYAMSAHLALNMVWLWLFLRDDRGSDAAALAVGFVACGLHQVVFHPFFVATFLLELLIARRWARAGVYLVAYAAMGVFWLFYWKIALPSGAGAAAGGGAAGLGIWLVRLHTVMGNFSMTGLGYMAKNLFRFLTWQNPLASALLGLALVPAVRCDRRLRPMALGLVLNLALLTAIMPYQGHGWGYRYLHGFLGTASLLCAFAWMRLGPDRSAARKALALTTAFSILVLTPIRAAQASAFIRPFARAEAAIADAPAEAVVVDATGMFFSSDLVRNDPFLRNRPIVLDLLILNDSQIRSLCAAHSVLMFDRGSRSGLRPVVYPARNLARLAHNRALMRSLSCGMRRVVVGAS